MGEKITNSAVQMDVKDGVATIEQGTILTRLHYFDGKFLRADALTLEQEYHRALVRLANLAGGWGVVHGLGISVSANLLTVTPGLAITPAGSTVLLSNAVSVEVAKLIAAAAPAPASVGAAAFHDCQAGAAAPTATSPGVGYYEITVGPLEGLCGNEEVFGKLCEDACVTDSQSPYWKEGMMLRLRPITLTLAGSSAVPPAAVHLRNRVASAYFASEPWLSSSLLSAAGLASTAWCNPAALYGRDEVPVGLLVQEGATTRFIDAWSARRERMDTQARGYWQGRMTMRPWNVFLAQILQFQCQLPGVFTPGPAPADDDCQDIRDLLKASLTELVKLRQGYADSSQQILNMLKEQGVENGTQFTSGFAAPDAQLEKLTSALTEAQDGFTALPAKRLLINAGFLDLPPAGYLPVDPARPSINEQLKRFFGEGVKLFFCTARPDYLAHAVEEVQHMERISLTRGLDDVQQVEEVEIFVPNGKIIDSTGADSGVYWQFALSETAALYMLYSLGLTENNAATDADTTAGTKKKGKSAAKFPMLSKLAGKGDDTGEAPPAAHNLEGLMRTTRFDNGGAAQTVVYRHNGAPPPSGASPAFTELGGYADWRILEDPFARQEGDQVTLQIEQLFTFRGADGSTMTERFSGGGLFTIESIYAVDNQSVGMAGLANLQVQGEAYPGNQTGNLSAKTRITITRQGDARSGQITLLPQAQPNMPLQLTWALTWKGKPRTASLRAANAKPSSSTAGDESLIVADMAELTVPLTPENPLRLAALNMLGELAGITNDQPFLSRARRNLFPDTAAGTGEMLVRATLDWVLFRRRRKADCGQGYQVPVAAPTVSMKFWHVRVDGRADLAVLQKAIDEDDLEAAKTFRFDAVDVLHYAAASSSPLETVTQIVGDWNTSNHGKLNVLGRAWASTSALQNEPHLARLIRLGETLNAVTTAPKPNTVAVMQRAPAALADSQFGGGFLLASFTQDESPGMLQQHRVVIISTNFRDQARKILDQGGAGIVQFLDKVANFTINLNFVDGVADVDTLTKIVGEFKQLAGSGGGEAWPLVSKAGTDAALMEDRSGAVTNAIGLKSAKPVNVAEPDFGDGIPGAVLLIFRQG